MSIKSPAGPQRPASPILIFDIETAPDIPCYLGCEDHPLSPGEDSHADLWNAWHLFQQVASAKNQPFPPPLFHTVVSLCGIFIDPETYRIMDGIKLSVRSPQNYLDLCQQEKANLAHFWRFCLKYAEPQRIWYDALQTDRRLTDYQLKKLKPLPLMFCGFNISGFDLPVIEQRSFRHGVVCPIADYSLELGTDSYRYRYAADKCFDIMQYLGNFGAAKVSGLQAYARSIGLAGKLEGMDGAQVGESFYILKEYDKIEEYCSIDVLITYGVFLRLQLFRGVIGQSLYDECLGAFHRFLCQDNKPQSYRKLADSSHGFFGSMQGESSPYAP